MRASAPSYRPPKPGSCASRPSCRQGNRGAARIPASLVGVCLAAGAFALEGLAGPWKDRKRSSLMAKRYFTVAEANSMVPWLERSLGQVLQLRANLRTAAAELERLGEPLTEESMERE